MKNNLRLLAVALGMGMALPALAQKDNVGIGTTKPDQSAALEISSSNKGLLMPRMSLQQRNSIQNPAKGLIVYQTDMLSGFYFFDGSEWKTMATETNANSVAADPNDWTMSGNSITFGKFLGTTNSEALQIRTNNVHSGWIEPNAAKGNTFLGFRAGLKTVNAGSTGINNTAFGYQAFQENLNASYNSAYGFGALLKLTSGNYNTGIGAQALGNLTTGDRNFGLGGRSLNALQTGTDNVGIGSNTFHNKTSGSSNLAIGTNALYGNITGSGNVAIGFGAGYSETGSNKLYIANNSTANPLIKGEFDNKNLKVNTGATVSSTVGFLAVGNFDAAYTMPASNSYRLIVQDGIITEKVKVALKSTADWADYVFEPSYKLMSLEKVEEFVKENKHLPNVPSAEDMSKNGLDVSQTSAKLMEKIEELTLYMIEMNKEIKVLKAENEALKKSTSKN